MPTSPIPPPDLQERRRDRWLLVWGDAPAWVVVDEEARNAIVAGVNQPGEEEIRTHLANLGIGEPCDEAADPLRIDNITINLTRRCGLACHTCYERGRPDAGGRKLDFEAIERALRALQPAIGQRASLAMLGGEPFLVPQLMLKTAVLARKMGLSVSVSTNGQHIDASLAKDLHRIGLRVQVSLDGATASVHDANRGEGTFVRALATVRALVEADVPTDVSMVVHRDNLFELPAFYDLALDLAVSGARFLPLKAIGGGRGLAAVPLPELMRVAFGVFEARPSRARLAGTDAFHIFARQCAIGRARRSCGAGRRTLLLDADGTLHPCLNLARNGFPFASVYGKDDVLAAWKEGLVQFRSVTDQGSSEHSCRCCAVRGWCLGGCRGEIMAGGGALNGRPSDCAERRQAVIDMLWTLSDPPKWLRAA